jgi:hypothetical protein
LALSKAREIALFSSLEVPYSPTTQNLSQDGTMSVQKVVPTAIACYYTIKTFLTNNIYTDADIEAALVVLLDKWIALSTRVDSLQSGSIGSLQGLNYSVPAERAEIARQVDIYVPYRRLQDTIARSQASVCEIVR